MTKREIKILYLTLEELQNGTLNREKQPEKFSIAPMIFKENCKYCER